MLVIDSPWPMAYGGNGTKINAGAWLPQVRLWVELPNLPREGTNLNPRV